MKNLAATFALLLTVASCKKAKDDHADSGVEFSCNVDGQQWESVYSSGVGDANTNAKLLYGGTALHILAYGPDIQTIGLIGYNEGKMISNGVYTLNSSKDTMGNASFDDDLSTSQYQTDSVHTGTLNIVRLDKSKKRVEGTFEFEAYHPVRRETVRVTDGRFSMAYEVQ